MIFANCDLKVIVLVIESFLLIYVIYHFNLHNNGFVRYMAYVYAKVKDKNF